MNLFKDRKYLHDRHRLSHQQIDRLLGESLAKNYLQEKIKAMELVRQLIGLADLLNEHNIPFISFKGPLLSQQIYGDPTVRISHDLDVLVAVEDVDRIHTILLSNGYELGYGLLWPTRNEHKKYFSEQVHHIVFKSKVSGIYIEVHWTLIAESPIAQKKMQKLLSKNTTVNNIGGREIRVFSPEFNLAYLLIHGAKHGWQRLKWLIDIKDYPYELVEYKAFIELIETLNSKKIVEQTGYLLKYYWGIDTKFFPHNKNPKYLIRRSLEMGKLPIVEDEDIKESLKTYWYRLLLFTGIRYKCRIIRLSLFSTGDLSRINYSFKAAYYLYRPYSFIKRRLIHAE